LLCEVVHTRTEYGRSAAHFAPVALVSEVPSILAVHPSLPVRSVSEFVAFAKEKPGQLSYASGGPGTSSHLLVELFKSMTGVEMMHVPYKGSPQAVADVSARPPFGGLRRCGFHRSR
jgi:tripartite-type tricarboxylate transporter receptor subunit TctC